MTKPQLDGERCGYIYVKNWKKFQHPDVVRTGHMPWLKMHTDLLGNDAWLELEPADRVLLQTIWMLTARYGHGRVIASLSWLQGQANLPRSNRYRGVERLTQAGFIEVRACKARASRKQPASLEGEKKEIKNARATASKPQAARVAALKDHHNGHEPARNDELNAAGIHMLRQVIKPMEGRP